MRTDYPAKILLAWGEAISGNAALRDWLITNGYPELGIFTFALRNKADARKWLMDNGHPHLMAVINGIEGNAAALDWLERNNMSMLKQVALTGDGDDEAFKWLLQHGHREMAMLGQKMRVVKAAIEEDNTDPHKYPKD
jgi:membrane protein required for beta-lactamase induction